MLEGLFAAIALWFAPAQAVAIEPTSVVSLEIPVCSLGPPPEPGVPRREPVFLSVDRDGSLWLGHDAVRIEALGQALRRRAPCDAGGCERIFVRADEEARYARVLQVLSTVRANGYSRVGLIDETGS